jgi:cytochrome c oxidase subunit 2
MKKKLLFSSILAFALMTALLTPSVKAQGDPRVVEITAKRFQFVPAEINLKKGETVTIKLVSEDVTHGFYNKPLKIDGDVLAGKTTEVTITPETVGRYVTICDHFCGANHGNMRMVINVVE